MSHSISVRIEDKTYAAIVKLAKKEERSINKMINILLREAVQRRGGSDGNDQKVWTF